jgi:hypothetical protein
VPLLALAFAPALGVPPKAQVAQLVEQRTENPRVGGSIPPLGTILFNELTQKWHRWPLLLVTPKNQVISMIANRCRLVRVTTL